MRVGRQEMGAQVTDGLAEAELIVDCSCGYEKVARLLFTINERGRWCTPDRTTKERGGVGDSLAYDNKTFTCPRCKRRRRVKNERLWALFAERSTRSTRDIPTVYGTTWRYLGRVRLFDDL
jgi:hypothetical protein